MAEVADLVVVVLVVKPPELAAPAAQGTLRQQILLKEIAEAVGKYRRELGRQVEVAGGLLPQEQTQLRRVA